MNSIRPPSDSVATATNQDVDVIPFPTVMIEAELIHFLRIPEISNAADHRHVIENLKRKHGLPRIHLCGKTVYLTDAVKQWLRQHVTYGN